MNTDGYKPRWQVAQDDAGRLIGYVYLPKQPTRHETQIIKEFLIEINKGKGTTMSKKQEDGVTTKVNMVWLGGTLKFDPEQFDNAMKALIDTGQKQAIRVGCRDELAKKLALFRQGDYIRVVAILEPYGVKQPNGEWKNGLGVRITEIKTVPPKRTSNPVAQADDAVPF